MDLVVLGLWLYLVMLSILSKLNHSPPAQLLSRITLYSVKFMPFSAEKGLAEICFNLEQYIFASF